MQKKLTVRQILMRVYRDGQIAGANSTAKPNYKNIKKPLAEIEELYEDLCDIDLEILEKTLLSYANAKHVFTTPNPGLFAQLLKGYQVCVPPKKDGWNKKAQVSLQKKSEGRHEEAEKGI